MSYPSNSESVAQDQLIDFVRRIESIEDETKALNADKSEVYREAKANGFDVKVLKRVIAERRLDHHERLEREAIFDLYWSTINGLAHARVENIDEFPDEDVTEGGVRIVQTLAASRMDPDEIYEPIGEYPEPGEGAPVQEPPGPIHADPLRSGAAEGNEAETAAPDPIKANPFRPHCLRPQMCAGMGKKHCFECLKAHADSEGVSA